MIFYVKSPETKMAFPPDIEIIEVYNFLDEYMMYMLQ